MRVEDNHVTKHLTRFASELRFADLPDSVVELMKWCIIDQLGVQFACSVFKGPVLAQRYARSFGSGAASVVGTSRTAPPELAAFANGVAGRGFELDDIHWASHCHPGAVIVPPALAVCEEVGASGLQLIESVASGYEVLVRVGSGLRVNERGFCPVGTMGPIGAAIAAGKAAGLSPVALFDAVGLACSHGGGTLEYMVSGGQSSQLHGGLAAMAGVRCAKLAEAGFEGPLAPLAGRSGFAHAYSVACDTEAMLAELGSTWRLLQNGFKCRPYPGGIHAVVDQALNALDAMGLTAGPELASNLARVRVGVGVDPARYGFGGTDHQHPRQHAIRKQLSMPWAVANALLHGGTLDSLLGAAREDFDTSALAQRVFAEFDPTCERTLPGVRVRVRLEFRDGSVGESAGYQKGSPDDPLTSGDLQAKFLANAARAIGTARSEELLSILSSLELLDNVRSLAPLLACVAPLR